MLTSLLLGEETTWYPITFDSRLNIARGVFFWLSIALALAAVICALVLKADARKKFLKIAVFSAVCYACAVGIILLVLSFLDDGSIEALLFYPLLALLLSVGGSAAAIYFKPVKLSVILSACVMGAALVAVLVCMGVQFERGDSLWLNWIVDESEENIDPSKVNQIGLYVSAALLVAALIAAALLLGKNEKKGFDSKSIVYAAICVAMSYALSYLRIVQMPQGGSITVASLLPLMIYSYMFGVKKGVFTGIIYGILQAFQDMYILHPAQFLLDYPVAFACIGFAGAFAKIKSLDRYPQIQIALGGIAAGLMRFVCHYLSGCFAFGAFAPEGQPVWLYSLIYQSGYVLPDIAIAIAAGVAVFCSQALVKQMKRSAASAAPSYGSQVPAAEVVSDEKIAEAAAAEGTSAAPDSPPESPDDGE